MTRVCMQQILDGRPLKCNYAKYNGPRAPYNNANFRGGGGRGGGDYSQGRGFRGDFRGGFRGARWGSPMRLPYRLPQVSCMACSGHLRVLTVWPCRCSPTLIAVH